MSKKFFIHIPLTWEYVRSVRQQVNEALAEQPEELRSAAVMVASELVENAIKYGVSVPELPWTRFAFETTADEIRMEIANGLIDSAVFAHLSLRIAELQKPGAGERLYLERLQQLVENPLPPNRLGLFRISFEGKFSLDVFYDNQVLIIKAHRKLL